MGDVWYFELVFLYSLLSLGEWLTIFHIVYLSLTTCDFFPILRSFSRKNLVLLLFFIFVISLILFDIFCKGWSRRWIEISVYSAREILRYFPNTWNIDGCLCLRFCRMLNMARLTFCLLVIQYFFAMHGMRCNWSPFF